MAGDKPKACDQRTGRLQRVLGLGSYQTAWTCLHKLRQAMVKPDREQFHGSIEVDETYVDGVASGGKRGAAPKTRRSEIEH